MKAGKGRIFATQKSQASKRVFLSSESWEVGKDEKIKRGVRRRQGNVRGGGTFCHPEEIKKSF